MLSQQLTLLLYDAKIQDDTYALLSLSKERNLKSKQSSNQISQIHARYNAEEEQIQNQLKEISAQRKENSMAGEEMSAEVGKELLTQYEELKGELNELKDKEDKEIANVEQAATDYENETDMEQTTIETDMEAAREDRNAIKENLDQDIERTFGYFKN